jgi:Ran GTPase-activating protein (RanGAP) involved in mRNA processing and transport
MVCRSGVQIGNHQEHSQVLLKNKAIQRIDLSDNCVGDEGAVLLVDNLKKSESSISIDYIGLRRCGISNKV